MPVQGTEKTLAALIQAELVKAKLPALPPDSLVAWEAVSKAIITHLVANIQVNPGIPVQTTGSPSAQSGSTVGTGTIT